MFGATKRIAMLGQVPLAGSRMGQINGGFSWNTAPGGWNPYVQAPQAQIPNSYGGPSAQAPATPVGSCFTCVNGSTGDAQYGVPATMANQLKSQGYRCHADDCANRPQATATPSYQGVMDYGSQIAPASFSGGFTPDQGGSFFGMMGRVRIQGGIGSRALGGW